MASVPASLVFLFHLGCHHHMGTARVRQPGKQPSLGIAMDSSQPCATPVMPPLTQCLKLLAQTSPLDKAPATAMHAVGPYVQGGLVLSTGGKLPYACQYSQCSSCTSRRSTFVQLTPLRLLSQLTVLQQSESTTRSALSAASS